LSGDWGTTKNIVLSSGIPLEIAAVRTAVQRGYADFGEKLTLRGGKFFSVDCYAARTLSSKGKSALPVRVHLLIECKFLRTAKAIGFAAYPTGEDTINFRYMSTSPLLLSGLHAYFGREELKTPTFLGTQTTIKRLGPRGFPPRIEMPFCNKGFVIGEKEAHDFMWDLQYGLTFPTMDLVCEDIDRTLGIYTRGEVAKSPTPAKGISWFTAPAISVFVPIVVTNAPLMILKENVAFEEIRASKTQADVFDDADRVTLTVGLPVEYGEYAREKTRVLDDRMREPDDDHSEPFFWDRVALDNLTRMPLRVHVVRLEALDDVLARIEADARAVARAVVKALTG
jgi:hypothetical protein